MIFRKKTPECIKPLSKSDITDILTQFYANLANIAKDKKNGDASIDIKIGENEITVKINFEDNNDAS